MMESMLCAERTGPGERGGKTMISGAGSATMEAQSAEAEWEASSGM